MFVKNYKWNGFKMPLDMKNINNITLPSEKNGLVDVTFTPAIAHQKHLAQYAESSGHFQYTPRIY